MPMLILTLLLLLVAAAACCCCWCWLQLPKLLELVGLGYTSWFVYRYLLFKVRDLQGFGGSPNLEEE